MLPVILCTSIDSMSGLKVAHSGFCTFGEQQRMGDGNESVCVREREEKSENKLEAGKCTERIKYFRNRKKIYLNSTNTKYIAIIKYVMTE